MAEIMDGQATPAQIGAFLLGLRMKGEGPDEIAGMATPMRERCASIRPPSNGRVVDLCGTGGAPVTTFNVSTSSHDRGIVAGFPLRGFAIRDDRRATRPFGGPSGEDLESASGD